MPQYMLVLRDNPAVFATMSPDEIQRVIQKYVAWGDSLRARGLLAGSAKLTEGAARVMRRENGRVRVLDGPYAEAKEVLGGYFTIQADSYDQAVERCQDCPHLEFGSIEIREVDQV
ncbi:MAG: YciI family protein [Vicinamibacterales bacterium]